MSRAIADFLYRRRIVFSALILLGAVLLAPRANITSIDNDLTAWFSRDRPHLSRVRALPRRVRRHAQPHHRDRGAQPRAPAQPPRGFAFLEEMSGDIERVDAVERVNSLATATVVDGSHGSMQAAAAGD